jgi:hypothetical protein
MNEKLRAQVSAILPSGGELVSGPASQFEIKFNYSDPTPLVTYEIQNTGAISTPTYTIADGNETFVLPDWLYQWWAGYCAEWTKSASLVTEERKDPPGSEAWPRTAPHDRVKKVLDDISEGYVCAPARKAIREAIDKADAPKQGRAKSDDALGKALRFTKGLA